MAKEPQDMVLRILQQIQGTLTDHSRLHEEQRRVLSQLQNGQNGIRESIVTALGLSAHANVRNDLMEDRIGKLEAMIQEFEALKSRVDNLEAEHA